jgi:hypothetical protein
MAEFKMTVNMDNAAFEDNNELVRILRLVADKVEKLKTYPFTLFDVNDNRVGSADVIEDYDLTQELNK